jgi:anthranilate phosphoribosyltransferase
MNIEQLSEKLLNKENLSIEETQDLFRTIMDGKIDDIKISEILTRLADKGEVSDEITGGANILREKSLKVILDIEALDMCGTGGDGKHTLNISTTSSIVLSSMGIAVAKHGNKALTSKSGSADVLEKLNINILQNPKEVKNSIEEKGFGFMFAPNYHLTMKNVANARKQLGRRTIFNLLGPLCNPANACYQCIGIYSKNLLEIYAESLMKLGVKKAWVFHSYDGLDEISIFDKTEVFEINNNTLRNFTIDPKEILTKNFKFEDIIGGDAEHNANKIIELFQGKNDAFLEIVSLNSAAGLIVTNNETELKSAYKNAKEHILSGSVMKKYNELTK